VGEKKIRFGQKRSPNCDFCPSIVLPPYPLLKTYDEWVRREGYSGPDLGEKNFQLSSFLIV
jgi:hypothetical protein